jgi:Xaa-Pro aminopeptidase
MTEHGPEWISAGIPKTVDDVEEWMAQRAAAAHQVRTEN